MSNTHVVAPSSQCSQRRLSEGTAPLATKALAEQDENTPPADSLPARPQSADTMCCLPEQPSYEEQANKRTEPIPNQQTSYKCTALDVQEGFGGDGSPAKLVHAISTVDGSDCSVVLRDSWVHTPIGAGDSFSLHYDKDDNCSGVLFFYSSHSAFMLLFWMH